MNGEEASWAQPTSATRADTHCHSSASQLSRLGVQRAVGLPECATPPEEVYQWQRTLERLAFGYREALARHGAEPQPHDGASGRAASAMASLAPRAQLVPARRRRAPSRTIAVALHGIEPATFERCALIRDWLDDHGVDRVTLLVIPARDLHPVGERSPEMVGWLSERRRAGDSIAQHGFQHVRLHRAASPRALIARAGAHRSGEFVGLDSGETRRAVHAGWRLLKLAGIEPDGFVAPAYAYTPALRRTLSARFRWWAGLLRLHRAPSPMDAGGPESLAPAWSLAAGGPVRGVLTPTLLRAGSLLPLSTLRIDLHPADLQHARHMLALEWVLGRAGESRKAVTYEQLTSARPSADG
jgi:predicted deacetylase